VDLVFGLSFGHGESVCAPTQTNPAPGTYAPPTAKAHTADMFRVKKYLPPGFSVHASRSLISCRSSSMGGGIGGRQFDGHGGRLEGKNQQQIFILGMTVTGRARAPRIRRR
jgi:hypothetical protein